MRTLETSKGIIDKPPALPYLRLIMRKPEKPLPTDCCGAGCPRCVYDIYVEQLEKYKKWKEENEEENKESESQN